MLTVNPPTSSRSNEGFTWLPAGLLTLHKRVEAVPVAATAAVPEARAALAEGVVVPLEDELGTGALLFRKLADVHHCGLHWVRWRRAVSAKLIRQDTRRRNNDY